MGNEQDNSTRCYGQRMLSPFRGVMHCVVTDLADAVTTDGRRWTLYVRGECLYDDPDEIRDQAISVSDVKYGSWSAHQGFQRAPIRLPTFEHKVCAAGDRLLDAVREHAPSLPFPLADHIELWLLHGTSGRPLALIGSSCNTKEREPPNPLRWTPGQACMAELAAAQRLAAVVAELAGQQPIARWFERHADGSATCCDPSANTHDAANTLDADAFNGFQLNASLLDKEDITLLEAVEQWQAPSLLQLPTLSQARRHQLETVACRHAMRLAEQLPLYPCVLDETAITAALVEARMRHSHAAPAIPEAGDRALSPYYLEIADD